MKRLLIGAVAALSIALGVATPAGGAPYTDTDLTFTHLQHGTHWATTGTTTG